MLSCDLCLSCRTPPFNRRTNPSPSLVSVAKLGAKVPLLGQGGEAAATGRGGGGSNGWEETCQQRDYSDHTTPVALRATSPPHLRRGVLLQSSEFRDRN